jgi:hypothetical protein
MSACTEEVACTVYTLLAEGARGWRGVFVFLVESTFVVAVFIKFVAKFVVYDLKEISGGDAVGYGELW